MFEKLQGSKKTRNSAKTDDFAKFENSGKRLSLEVNKMALCVATLYKMYQKWKLGCPGFKVVLFVYILKKLFKFECKSG